MPRAVALALLGSRAAAQAAPLWELHLLSPAAAPAAKCLDGSQPGFYFARGSGAGASQWIIHTQGGGWCTSDAECASRAGSPLGSSASWGAGGNCSGAAGQTSPVCYADGGANGMLSGSAAENPVTYNWNRVFIN